MKKSLLETNPYLKDPAKRKKLGVNQHQFNMNLGERLDPL
jgi:hypothetical protein